MILGEPIILGGGGGIACVVIITTDPSAIVTCSLGNTSISKTANADGKAAFELKKAGVWTITASLNGETVSKEIDTSFALETEIQFSKPLAECTWEEISAVSKSGNASKWWSVGDTRPIVISGVTYTAQIMDFDMYDVSDPASYGREKAGVVFQLVELFNETENASGAESSVDSAMTASAECSDLIPTIKYPYLSSGSATSVSIGTAKGILASEEELFGASADIEDPPAGTQFAFYAAGNSRIKKVVGKTTASKYWTRSYRKNVSGYLVIVSDDGTYKYGANGSRYNYTAVFCL